MKITKIVINNFKSLGEEKNILYPEKTVSVVIGKNESGKSNLLECLSILNFFAVNRLGIYKNKLNTKTPVITLSIDFDENEISKLGTLIENPSIFEFKDGQFPLISGGLSSFISEKIVPLQTQLLDFITTISGVASDTKKTLISYFTEEFNTDISKHRQRIQTLKGILDNKSLSIENTDEIKEKTLNYENYINCIESILPIFFKFNEQEISASYTLDEFKKNVSQKSIINTFFTSANIGFDDVIAALSSSDAGEKQFFQEKIAQKLNILSNDFSKFYQKEKVSIKINFETNKFNLLVDTAQRPLYITERSNGLRWYLNLFIQLREQNLLEKNIVLLIDEPGVYLHIDAQANLVELFKDFGTKNQILYTTHSPFMIDSSYLSNIRLVSSVNGYTHIFNSISDLQIPDTSKEEVLSPLCKALGFSVKYNIGPSRDKQNIIVEGITDYYYLKGAMNYFKIEENSQPYILPSIGVSNINRIASILLGWGCIFKVMVDYDEQAYYEYERLCKLGLTDQKDIFTVSCKKIDKDNMFTAPITIEDIFSDEDKQKFDCGEKTLNAKKFLELTECNDIQLSETTIQNIKTLLQQLGII